MQLPISLLKFCLLSSIFAWPVSSTLEIPAFGKTHTHNPISCGCEPELLDDVNLWLDMIIIVDSSDDVDEEDFSSIKAFLLTLSRFIAWQDRPDKYSRIAILNTARTAEVFADLETYKTPAQMDDDVMVNLRQRGGNFNMTAGLVAAHDMINFENAHGSRTNVKRAVVIFTTTTWNCSGDSTRGSDNQVVCQLFSELETDSSTLIAIGLKVGHQDTYPFVEIPDKCNYIASDMQMVQHLLSTLCYANCYCQKAEAQFRVTNQCVKYAECIDPEDFSLSYAAALETCTVLESDELATTRSEEEEKFVYNFQSSSQHMPYWIGLNYTDGRAYYSDGTPLAYDDYTNWCTSSNQPSTAGACVYVDKCGDGSGWFTAKCGHFMPTYYFSCQKPACSVSNFCSE